MPSITGMVIPDAVTPETAGPHTPAAQPVRDPDSGYGFPPEHGGRGGMRGNAPPRLAWGDAYDIGFESGRWTAISRDAKGRTFGGKTPDALNHAIRADWTREAAR